MNNYISKNAEIERLRAVAVIMTTVAHGIFSSFLPLFMVNPFSGVDIFFVISGFVVTQSLLRLLPKKPNKNLEKRISGSKKALKIFYLKRAFRILPLATFWLFAYLLLSVVFRFIGGGGNFGPPDHIAREVIAVLSGFHNYFVSYGLTGNIAHFWSLCVEEQFYAILPVFMVVYFTKNERLKKIGVVLLLLLVALPIVRDITQIPIFRHIYGQRYFTLLFGVVLGLTTSEHGSTEIINKKFVFIKYLKLFLAPIIILVTWIIPGIPVDGTGNLMNSVGFLSVGLTSMLLVYLAGLEQGWILNIPVLRTFLEYVGSRSYGIYLSHFAFVRLKPTILTLFYYQLPRWVETTPQGRLLQDLLAWIGILVVCEICYRKIEKPMIDLGKRYVSVVVK